MKYGYYPGCSLEGISVEYNHSMRSLFTALEVTIEDLPDWICCGTLAAPSISRLLGIATPLWNVAKAKQEGFEQLVAPCSACVYHFKNAENQVNTNSKLMSEVEAVLETSLTGLPRTVHPLEILVNDGFEERIKSGIKQDLSDLKVVSYYGCHISRPADVMQFDDPEDPQSMDLVLSWVGVQTLDWSRKVDCCGAHFSLIKPDIVVDLCTEIIESALEAGADAIVVACPMCHANLDTRQGEIAQKLGRSIDIPILYFSQVLGYALGIEPKTLGMKKHIVDPLPLMLEKCQPWGNGSPVLQEVSA
ncbi:MAG: CoB--CoM heterodisulfide reductase iron-sulfur subunit B family protein [Chloroflexota bacterium]|nr:MAG: CoB--CoM heterodisulfide reductase iron-sulfur subunit B family protein [Chloroflexota bacterium]UCF28394.1 MAG: CoB--CoM heterodisulfide reductase iron-sulfur subunit B family protein [Chloroflexota bacterium]